MAAIDKEHIIFRNGVYQNKYSEIKTKRFQFMFSANGAFQGMRRKEYQEDWLWTPEQMAHVIEYSDMQNESCKKIIEKQLYFVSDLKTDFILFYIEYPLQNFHCFFLFSGNTTYATLGGYGHYVQPYLHFINRGYGEKFEKKMLKECYRYLCSDILEDVVKMCWKEKSILFQDHCYVDDQLKVYQKKLRYTWMPEEENE
jgi:hypothetical protein